MIRKRCSECGRVCWHNPLKKTKDQSQSYRCTFCGYPLGTGPKRERMIAVHAAQLVKPRPQHDLI